MLFWHYWSSFWNNIAEMSETASKPAPVSQPEPEVFSPREKYEYLIEYGTQILCVLNPTYGSSYLSRNFETITGNHIQNYEGEAFYDIVHSDFISRLKELLETPAPAHKPHHFRCKLRHGDDKYYWYLLLIHTKNLGENICIMENVHDTILIQNSLQKAKLDAELALRARSEFLANMSHDLRTPLNAVIGFAQIMENQIFGKIENPQYLEYAKHIQESGYDLLAKIEDLLEIANIDAGRVTLDREEVYLSNLIRHVIAAQHHHAQSAKVEVEYQPLDGDALLHADRLKLQHILSHLLANAIKFSAPGSKVTISASIEEDGSLGLNMRDEGAGMSKAKLADITEALSQENCWSSKNNTQLGLGLALTKEFVALHNGSIHLTSRAGVGTTVHIALPADCVKMHNTVDSFEYAQVAG